MLRSGWRFWRKKDWRLFLLLKRMRAGVREVLVFGTESELVFGFGFWLLLVFGFESESELD